MSSGLAAEQHAALQAAVGERPKPPTPALRRRLSLVSSHAAPACTISASTPRSPPTVAAKCSRCTMRRAASSAGSVGRPIARFIGAMAWLWGLLGLVGIALALAAYISVRATRRLTVFVRAQPDDDPQADHAGSADRAAEPARDARTSGRSGRGARRALRRLRTDRHRRLSRRQRHARPRRRRHHALQHRRTAQSRRCRPARMFGRFEDDAFAAVVAGDDARCRRPRLPRSFRLRSPRRSTWIRSWQISASIGIAKAPDDGTTGDELQRQCRLGAAHRQARRPRIGASFRAGHSRRACRAALFPARTGNGDRGKMPSTCTISRSSPPKAAAWSASKRCCAGIIRRAARSRRRCSFRWPSKAA